MTNYLENEEIESFASMKEEALKRMGVLGLSEDVIFLFEKENKLSRSEDGKIYPLTDEETEMIKNYQETWGHLAYHIIHTFSNCGETYEIFFVSCYKEDWDYDWQLIRRNLQMVYAENITVPDFSETGSIMFVNRNGSLYRIG